MEIYCGNKSKDNQLSEEHKLITKSDKAALYHPHCSTFKEWNISKMEQSLHKMQYFINLYENMYPTFHRWSSHNSWFRA